MRSGPEATISFVGDVGLGATFVLSIRDITRRMSGTESTSAIMAVSTGSILLCGLITLPLSYLTTGIGAWRMPTLEEFGLLALTGTLQGVGQYFMVTAFLLAEAVVVVPFRYFSLIFAVLFGYLLFGDVPDPMMFSGAAAVVARVLYFSARSGWLLSKLQLLSSFNRKSMVSSRHPSSDNH